MEYLAIGEEPEDTNLVARCHAGPLVRGGLIQTSLQMADAALGVAWRMELLCKSIGHSMTCATHQSATSALIMPPHITRQPHPFSSPLRP